MSKGKFDSDRDSALHFLCSSDWGNESFGDCSTWGKYVWRISNSWEDVKPENTEFSSVLREWLKSEVGENWFQLEADTEELRKSFVGHFLVIEVDNGFVSVIPFNSEAQLIEAFTALEQDYEAFDDSEQEG